MKSSIEAGNEKKYWRKISDDGHANLIGHGEFDGVEMDCDSRNRHKRHEKGGEMRFIIEGKVIRHGISTSMLTYVENYTKKSSG